MAIPISQGCMGFLWKQEAQYHASTWLCSTGAHQEDVPVGCAHRESVPRNWLTKFGGRSWQAGDGEDAVPTQRHLMGEMLLALGKPVFAPAFLRLHKDHHFVK